MLIVKLYNPDTMLLFESHFTTILCMLTEWKFIKTQVTIFKQLFKPFLLWKKDDHAGFLCKKGTY